tara:strand:+ start:204 stop:3284 length:3081 start_codon:yes stop_codon:yes gene_type:complete
MILSSYKSYSISFSERFTLVHIITFTISIAFLCCISPLYGQVKITGLIFDSESEEPIPGVNIIVKDKLNGTSTDKQGYFSLSIEENDQFLVLSYIGYKTKVVEIDTMSILRIELEQIVGTLDEIVVVGYGSLRKRDLTGAIGRLKSEDIGKISSLNAEQSLQGKVAGVQISTISGAPGAGAAVRIRGVGTFGNSSPVYVVDGVILDDIQFLNSSDIKSMEVLKDASATAIYGSRGANGVILVQTNKGSSLFEKPVITISTETGVQQLEKKIDLLDGKEFAIIANEIRAGTYNNVDVVPNTDWQDLVFTSTPQQNHQISIKGGNNKTDYYLSIGYFRQDGIIQPSSYQRLNLKLNNSYKFRRKVRIGNNITIAPFEQRVVPDVTFQLYRAQPVMVPYYEDGSFGVVPNVGNPLADIANSNSYNNGTRAVGNIFAEYIFNESLLFRTSFGTDVSVNKYKSFTPAFTVFNPDGSPSQQNNNFSDILKSNSFGYNWLWENTLNFIHDFSKVHNVNLLAGFTMQETRSEIIGLAGQNVIRDGEDFWYILPPYIRDESNNIDMVNSIYNGVDPNRYYNMISYLGRIVYSFNDTYITTLSLRSDGSSKFSEGNKWGIFPSIAFGWNIDQENLMKEFQDLDFLKLRFSWGVIGNERITYFDRFSRVNAGLQAIFGNPDAAYVASTYGKLGNPNLKWESTTQTDIGLEMGLFNYRLTTEIDYYKRITDDILVELSTPGHIGNGQGQKIRYNAASVQNKGIEFSLDWSDKFNDLSYSIGIIANTIHNEILEIGGSDGIDSTLIGGNLANGQQVTLSKVGLPIGAFYGYKTDGIFQNQNELDHYPHLSQASIGDLRILDLNSDGIINGDDRTYLGSPIPDFVYGWSIDIEYSGFDFSMNFQGQIGNNIFNGKNVVRPDPYNFEKHVWDRWTNEGSSLFEPKPSYGGYNYLPSDRFIHDGSYLRLRSLILGYSFSNLKLGDGNINELRLYVKANNLFTKTSYSGYTPEIGSYDVLSSSIDKGIYPIPRILSFGMTTSF